MWLAGYSWSGCRRLFGLLGKGQREHGLQMDFGDVVSLPPALHSRVIQVAERPRDGPDAAALANDLSMVHTQLIRTYVQPVNVESVSGFCEYPYVAEGLTIGARLRAMRERAGLSMRELAKRSGYSQASSIQRYFDDDYEPARLPADVAHKLAKGFEGTDVTPAELMEMTGFVPPSNALPFLFEGASTERLRQDVPIYGTALGADEIIDGEAIEQTTLNTGEIIGYLKRPAMLSGRTDVYGLYVQGSSMAPRHRDGATIFVERNRPPRIGDDVVVYLVSPDEHDGERTTSVLVKTLEKKTAAFVELSQYSPATTFRIPAERVARIDRVIPWDELVH
jgi:transcriptional regulator with XRE-family HTH domain